VVVLSDTHMPRRGRILQPKVHQELQRADLIVHLGDFTSLEVADQLETYAPLVAVHGNNDREEVRQRYPVRRRVMIEGKELVLLHGDIGGRTALQAALAEEAGDVILFGHSHLPYNEIVRGKLLFNPGSPTDKRWGPHRSFGTVDIGESIDAKVHILD
jgi:uncharacterized protein